MVYAFIRYVHNTRCKPDQKIHEATAAIETAVKHILTRILKKVAELNPVFEVSKIVEGGSFYEGTKVGEPDEFDFMVVLKTLSNADFIEVENGCAPWYKKIKVSPKSDIYNNYKSYTGDRLLQKLSAEKMVIQFWNYVDVVCKHEKFSEEIMPFGKITLEEWSLKKLLLLFSEHIPSTNIPYNPNNNSKALISVNAFYIGVDIMLAIDYPYSAEIINGDGFPTDWSALVTSVGCHLVAKMCQSQNPCSTCWHVTLAYAELNLMRDLDDKHKTLYKVLKYLLIREIHKLYKSKCANLSSYMLKNALLFHCYEQNRCTGDISTCVFAILEYLACNLREGTMPCFLSRNINTWGHLLKYPVFRPIVVDIEWYGVLWLELLRRVVMKAGKLLAELTNFNDPEVLTKFTLMKESIIVIIQNYCTETLTQIVIRQAPYLHESTQRPTEISDTEINEKFARYCERLEELNFKFGDLSSLPNPLSLVPKLKFTN